jgi:S-(hydroxymethyl)mycothiol dehydrogenase
MLAYGGTATLIGVHRPGARASVDLGDPTTGFFRNTFTLAVSHGGDSLPAHDYPILAQLYLDGKLDLDGMVTHEVQLADIDQGFELMQTGASIRTIVRFD